MAIAPQGSHGAAFLHYLNSVMMKKHLSSFVAAALSFALLGPLVSCRQEEPENPPESFAWDQQETASPAAEPSSGLSQEGMAPLRADDLALRLPEGDFTWAQIQEFLADTSSIYQEAKKKSPSSAPQLTNGLDSRQQQQARRAIRQLIRQRVLLAEARKTGSIPGQDAFKTLALRWEKQNKARTSFEDFLKKFPLEAKSPLQLTRQDMLLLTSYLEQVLDQVEIPADMLEKNLARLKELRESLEAEQARKLEDFKLVAQMDGFQTDEGFALLARNFSEGAEASKGGVFENPMTRQEIQDCNWGQPFLCQKGETSGLIETPTSYRYIRVLDVYPAARAGEAETLKVAQILLAKRELEGLPTEEEIKERMRYHFQEEWVMKKIAPILRSDAFACPLFPNILEGWLPEEDASSQPQ